MKKPKKIHCLEVDLRMVSAAGVIQAVRVLQDFDRLSLVIPLKRFRTTWKPLHQETVAILAQGFSRHVIDVFLASGWPGNEYTNHAGLVCVFRFDQQFVDEIGCFAQPLSNWTNSDLPRLPEDLCLFSTKATFPLFLSCTHESEGWIVQDREFSVFGQRSRRVSREEMLLFEGPAFCKPWRNQNLPSWTKELRKG